MRRKLFAAAFVLFASTGCGNKQKVAECRAVIASINSDVDTIHKRIGSTSQGSAAVRELESLASGMDDAAKNVGEVKVTLAPLAEHVKSYQQMAKQLASAARALSQAVDKVDVEQIDKAEADLKRAMKQEEPVVSAITSFCQTQ